MMMCVSVTDELLKLPKNRVDKAMKALLKVPYLQN